MSKLPLNGKPPPPQQKPRNETLPPPIEKGDLARIFPLGLCVREEGGKGKMDPFSCSGDIPQEKVFLHNSLADSAREIGSHIFKKGSLFCN